MERFSTPSCIGTKHMASERRKSSSRGRSRIPNRFAAQSRRRASKNGGKLTGHYVVCVCNDDYPASLELRKLYRVVHDDFGEKHDLIRVIDESGDDYLYPGGYFVRVDLPKPVEQK